MPDTLTKLWIPSAAALGSLRKSEPLRSNPARGNTTPVSATATGPSFSHILHSVRQGETLSGIVRDHLESTGQPASPTRVHEAVRQVALANHIENPNSIHVRQSINLACLKSVNATAPAPAETRPEPTARSVEKAAPTVRMPETPALPAQDRPRTVSELRQQLAADVRRGDNAYRDNIRATESARPAATEKAARAKRPDLLDLVRRILHPKSKRAEAHETVAERREIKTQESAPQKAAWQNLLDQDAWLSSPFGTRNDPFSGNPTFHQGIDLAAPAGTAIRPMRDGTVSFSGWMPGYGRTVMVRHADGTESLYGHTRSTHVRKGERVTAETMIARVGSTGRSTGPHLHFEVRRDGRAVDPEKYLAEDTPVRLASTR